MVIPGDLAVSHLPTVGRMGYSGFVIGMCGEQRSIGYTPLTFADGALAALSLGLPDATQVSQQVWTPPV